MKKLSFVEAVKSGKDFRCVNSGVFFKTQFLHTYHFDPKWLDREFEIDEVKKELTASEIEEAFEYAWANSRHAEIMRERLLKKLGF